MQEILIFRHAPHEGPGYLADYLDRHGLRHRLVRVDQNDPVPASIAGIPGLVFMGGPMSVNDPLPWIPKALHLIKEAVGANVPVLGHCLGGQLIAKALGGVVTKTPVKEIGWLPVRRVDSPAATGWLDDLPHEFEGYHWHGETFSIPPRAVRILAPRARARAPRCRPSRSSAWTSRRGSSACNASRTNSTRAGFRASADAAHRR